MKVKVFKRLVCCDNVTICASLFAFLFVRVSNDIEAGRRRVKEGEGLFFLLELVNFVRN